MRIEQITEKWSQKYKSSINCSNPKGFSQKAHCAGRKKKTNEAPLGMGSMELDADKVQQSIDYFYNDHAPNKIGGRKEEGSFKGLKIVSFTKAPDTLMFLVDNNDQAVFYVAYSQFEKGVAIGNVRSNGTVKATEVYAMLVDKFGTLYSDSKQTPQGAKIWTSLAKFYPNLAVKDTGDRLVATKKKNEEAPPGREKQVRKLKKKFDDPGAPYAIAWAQHNKHGKPKKEGKLNYNEDLNTQRGRLEYYLKQPSIKKGMAIHLGKLPKYHNGKDELAELVPERNGIYALNPDAWEGTFYSLTNKDLKKINLYQPAIVKIPQGSIVADMAIANQFYRTNNPEEKEKFAKAYKDSIVPYGSDTSHIKMPEIIMPSLVESLEEGVNDPHIFKAVFMAGGPGSGKSFVAQNLLGGTGLRPVNSDEVYEFLLKRQGLTLGPDDIASDKGQEIRGTAKDLTDKRQNNYIDGRLGLIIDGTGKVPELIQKLATQLKSIGYSVSMIFVNTSLEVAQQRNLERERTLPKDIVANSWNEVQQNLMKYQQIFGADRFHIVDNSGGLEDLDRTKNFDKVYNELQRFINTPPKHKKALEWIQNQKAQNNARQTTDSAKSDGGVTNPN